MIHSADDNKNYYFLGRRAKIILAPSLTGLWIIFYIGDDLKKFAGTPFSHLISQSITPSKNGLRAQPKC